MAASVLPLLGGCSEILRPGVTGSDSLHDTSTGGDTGGTGTTVGAEVPSTGAGGSTDGGAGDIATTDPMPTDLPTTCSQWEQDCPAGYKCSLRAAPGGTTLDETACVPISPDPKPLGASCSLGGDLYDGIDECDRGAMCWRGNLESDFGTCQAFCGGSEEEPTCDGTCAACSISVESVRTLCFESCEPLLQNCGAGEGCYPVPEGFACFAVESGNNVVGTPCNSTAGCLPGLLCVDADTYPDCPSNLGCCSSYCDLDGPSDFCGDIAPGMICLPWDPGATSDGACLGDRVGICVLPS